MSKCFFNKNKGLPPLSKRAALFEPPPGMIEEARRWADRIYAGMCLQKLRHLGIATPERLSEIRSILQQQIDRLSKDISSLEEAKSVVEKANIGRQLAPTYKAALKFFKTKSEDGRVLFQPISIDTSNLVWWIASSDNDYIGDTPPKLLAKVRAAMEKAKNTLRPVAPLVAAETVRLMNRLTQLSGGLEFPIQTYSEVFPIDLSNWRYSRDIQDVPDNWRQYTLSLVPWSDPKAAGMWVRRSRTITGFLGPFLTPPPENRHAFENRRHRIRFTLEHELVHLAQSLLKALKVLREEPGLLARRKRKPKTYDIYGELPEAGKLPMAERESWMEPHELREIEFHPNLRDQVNIFRRIAARTRPERRRALLLAWLLPPEETRSKIPPSWWPDIEWRLGRRDFFHILRWQEPDKWRAATVKFIKSIKDLL